MGRGRDSFEKLENEDQLLERARLGCKDSMEVLYRQYLPFLNNLADRHKRSYKSVEFDDAFQQATIHFMDAVRTYRKGHGTGLQYWVVKCVSLQMVRFWRRQMLVKIPDWPTNRECKAAAEKVSVSLFSEMSKIEKSEEVCRIDPEDESVESPLDGAIALEEKEILESAVQKLEPLDRVLVRGRIAGKFYEECGEDVCRELGMNISTHRESVRQRTVRAFGRLQDRVFEVIESRRPRRTASMA